MSFLLRLVSIEAIINFLVDYLAGLVAGTVKNPTSDQARILFKALDALQKVIDQVNAKRGAARASTDASVNINNFWVV